MLSESARKEFSEIAKNEFGVDLTDEVATELAINLLTAFKATYRPVKKVWVKDSPEDKKSS